MRTLCHNNNINTFCHFCGRPRLLNRQTSRAYIIQYIILFYNNKCTNKPQSLRHFIIRALGIKCAVKLQHRIIDKKKMSCANMSADHYIMLLAFYPFAVCAHEKINRVFSIQMMNEKSKRKTIIVVYSPICGLQVRHKL